MAQIYLVDGSAYVYRAYHAIKPLSTKDGLPTNAIYGFTSMLRRLIKERAPKYLAVAFDTKGPVFRHQLYAEYKANRPPMPADLASQMDYIRQTVDAYGIFRMEQSDQEADDLIASVVRCMVEQGHETVVVSGDKDLLQLVSPQVQLWDPMRDRVMNEEAVRKKYGFAPALLLDYFALTGDSADNIPGVPGIGPKSAEKLLAEYGSLDQLLHQQQASALPSKPLQRVLAHKELALLSRDLVRLNNSVSVPTDLANYAWRGVDAENLRLLWTELEFDSLLQELPAASARMASAGFRLISTPDALAELMARLAAEPLMAVDTETDGLDPRTARLLGVSLARSVTEAWYLPCGHRDNKGQLLPGQLSLEVMTRSLRPLLEQEGMLKVGHNLKFDLAVLAAPHNGGMGLAAPLYDTMVAAWLLDPDKRRYKLDELALELGFRLTSFAEVTSNDPAADAFSRVDLAAACAYSCEDAAAALALYERQQPQLAETGLEQVMRELESPFIAVLATMEAQGVQLDAQQLARLSNEFSQRLEVIEEAIAQSAGRDFNINSPKQLGEVLFEHLLLPKGRKTKTGWSTDVKVLEQLSQHHPLPGLILQHRNLTKLKSTYVEKLATLQDPESGRVHSSFNQCGTATGRLSSSQPNLQNIPIRGEEGRRIRSAFIAPAGSVLLSADYSQIDLRVLAHYSQDEQLIAAFAAGDDIHRRTAAEIFFIDPERVTSEMRRVAKTINFGIVYGMSSFGLATQLQLSRKQAQTFIDRYFAHFSGIRRFMAQVVEQAREDGFVSTLLGRKRFLPELRHSQRVQREFAERIAINTPIQGTAADIIKVAMLRLHEDLRLRRLQTKMVLQIHDELVFEAPRQELEVVAPLVKERMEQALALRVPLVAHLHHGPNLDKETPLA